ncbi:hypothetical protein GCM10022223_10090 [Kineosporia mesophila]|uniref:Polymerase/histidinol phosphatase N-terminal domain-containing protein n=1 Tax=Kineosporia mesophila TaxID=566012 RepID=A0ABP6Z355_9ACTN|nr:CehA/McbA family metallohydrolase [Kineosporia mesophila]MCD5353929.1 CehA/McbA family metallohydrolase [Kineosporia mesophila]
MPANWYRGDCHIHSVYSDGELAPRQLVTAARAAGLDFIATTDHNTAAAHDVWAPYTGDDLLVITGEEVTTRTGHWLALGIATGRVIDWRYGADDDVIGRHLDEVHSSGGLGVVAHPHAPFPTGTFEYPWRDFDVVEVWNGRWTSDRPWNADNEAALGDWARNLAVDVPDGRWRPAIGGSDTHLEHQIGVPHTVVAAENLGAGAVLAGIRAGRSWIAGSRAVELSFGASAGDDLAGIGERLTTRGRPVVVHLEVSGVPDGTAVIHTDRGEVYRESFRGPRHVLAWTTEADGVRFARAEIRHRDGSMAALTNPVILV